MGDMLGPIKGGVVNFVVRNLKKLVPAYELPNAIRFKQALREGASQRLLLAQPHQDDIAFLQYTGGTTGLSKGAMLSHRNVIANLLQN
jgi:long-chain acyl-CoA synthetase